MAWEATPMAEAPRPNPDPPFFVRPAIKRPAAVPSNPPRGTRVKKLTTAGTFMLAGVNYKVDGRRALEQVLVITDGEKITVADLEGELLIEHTRGGIRRQWQTPRARTPRPGNVTEVLTHQRSPKS